MKIEEINQPDDWKAKFLSFARAPVGFMLFAGKNGTGKTTSAESIFENSRIVLKNPQHDAKMLFTQVDLFMQWMKDTKRWGDPTYLFERLVSVRLLVLDDVGTRAPTEAFKDFIYAVIEKRERNKSEVGTIITTNMNSAEMRDKFGDAIVSRVASGQVFRFEGKDRRFKDF